MTATIITLVNIVSEFMPIIISVGVFIAVIALYIHGKPRNRKTAEVHKLIPRDALSALGSPSLVLAAAATPAFSKIGGKAELSPDLSWPIGKTGPRIFLAQLDLSELKACGGPEWLPSSGRIYAFADDERGGFADHVVILASEQEPQAAPTDVPAKEFRERRVTGRAYTSFPSPDWLGVDGVEGEQEGLDEFITEPEPVGHEGMHRVGGFPGEIQGGRMSVECEYLSRGLELSYDEPIPDDIEEAAGSWRLLLQIDSDRDLKMNWWDSGRYYVFVREEDARTGDFSKTVTLSQSC